MSIRKNTAINVAGSIIPVVVMLITVPLYLDLLGDIRYGVLALVWLVIGYFSFMEMGLGKATANQIAQASEKNSSERAEIFWTAVGANLTIGIIAAIIIWIIGEYLVTHVLVMPDTYRKETLAALPWIIATFPLALVTSVLNGALEGVNKFLLLNIIQTLGTIVFQLFPLLIAYKFGPSLEYVIPAAVIAKVITNIPLLYVCHLFVTNRSPFKFSFARVKVLLSFGGWVSVSTFATPTLESIDRVVIGSTLGAKAVTYYTIAYQLAAKIRIIPGSLSRAIFPRISSESNSKSRHDMAVHALQSLSLLMTPIIVIVILLLSPFLNLWLGFDVAEKIVSISYLFFFGIWVNSIGHVPVVFLIGKGTPEVVAKVHLAEVLPFIALVYIGAISFGVIGVVMAWAVRVIVDTIIMCHLAKMHREALKATMQPAVILIFILGSAYLNNQNVIETYILILNGAIAFGLSIWLARFELKIFMSRINPKSRLFQKVDK